MSPSTASPSCGFDSVEDIGKAFTHPRYLEIIRPDEAKFVDFANSRMFIVEDVEIGVEGRETMREW